MSLEIYKKIELENKLSELIKNGKTKEETLSILLEEEKDIDANYIIEACLMPIDEITKEIEKYDSSSPKLDEIKFINELCKRYNVDRKAIIERIQNVRSVNKQDEFDTAERLKRLKEKRDNLKKEKDKLSDKSMDFEEKSMYYFGLVIVTIVGGLLFYASSPLLVGIIPIVYAGGFPTLRTSLMYKKEFLLVNELVDLDKEINYIERKLNDKESTEFEISQSINKHFLLSSVDEKKEESKHICVTAEEFQINNLKNEGPTLVKRKNR